MRMSGMIFRVHAQIDGTKYEPGAIKASEAEQILKWTGYSVKEWEAKLVGDGDPLAAQALVALMEFRSGKHPRFSNIEIQDVDSIDADFRNERGQLLRLKVDDASQQPVLRGGSPVMLLDGEEYEPPLDETTSQPV